MKDAHKGSTLIMKVSLALLMVVAASLNTVLAQETGNFDRYGYGHRMMGWDGGWSMMIFGPFFMVLTLVVLIAAIVVLVRWLGGSWSGSSPFAPSAKSPQDILKERFARGEIDKTEFEERRRVLGD